MSPKDIAVPLKRRAILDAALALFDERTYPGTPVPEIAQRARVAAGTLYRYFPSKEALVNELYRECCGAQAAHLLRELDAHAPPRKQFAALWAGLWRFAADQPEAFRFLETQHHDAYLDAESRRIAALGRRPWRQFVSRGQEAGALRAGKPDRLIALALGAFVGIARSSAGSTRDRRDSEDAVWQMLRA